MQTLQQRPTVNTEEESPRLEHKELEGGAPIDDAVGEQAEVDLSDNDLVLGLQAAMGGDRGGSGSGGGKDKGKGVKPGSGVLKPSKTPEQIKRAEERERRRQVQRDEDEYDAQWGDRDGMREVYRLDPEKVTGSATIVGAIPQKELATDRGSLGHAHANVKGQMLKEATMPFQSSSATKRSAGRRAFARTATAPATSPASVPAAAARPLLRISPPRWRSSSGTPTTSPARGTKISPVQSVMLPR
jgi:hypothetical protein